MSWAIWLTGPPAAGKTTLARAFCQVAAAEGVAVVHLESDPLRKILTPDATYEPGERDRFYRQIADIAALLVAQGFPVVVDATAPRRLHRQYARSRIQKCLEVLVETPLAVREERDPKGLYRLARLGKAPHVPGATEPYDEPEAPDLVLPGAGPSEAAAAALLRLARQRGLL